MYVSGPKLPYDLESPAMSVTLMTERIFLIGGYRHQLKKNLNGMLELINDMSEWREVGFPLHQFRMGHLALQSTSGNMINICGKW